MTVIDVVTTLPRCVSCDHPMRGSRAFAADYPGSRIMSGKGICKTCARISREELHPENKPVQDNSWRFMHYRCIRCGIDVWTEGAACTDCRRSDSVLVKKWTVA